MGRGARYDLLSVESDRSAWPGENTPSPIDVVTDDDIFVTDDDISGPDDDIADDVVVVTDDIVVVTEDIVVVTAGNSVTEDVVVAPSTSWSRPTEGRPEKRPTGRWRRPISSWRSRRSSGSWPRSSWPSSDWATGATAAVKPVGTALSDDELEIGPGRPVLPGPSPVRDV